MKRNEATLRDYEAHLKYSAEKDVSGSLLKDRVAREGLEMLESKTHKKVRKK